MMGKAHEPRMGEALGRLLTYSQPAAENLARLEATIA